MLDLTPVIGKQNGTFKRELTNLQYERANWGKSSYESKVKDGLLYLAKPMKRPSETCLIPTHEAKFSVVKSKPSIIHKSETGLKMKQD